MAIPKEDSFFDGYTHTMIKIIGDLNPFNATESYYIDDVASGYEGYYDIYSTPNTFKSVESRAESNLLQLRMLWCDIDNVENVEETIKQIDILVKENKIPRYHKVIYTGGGIHIKWVIKDYAGTNKTNLMVWKKLQYYLNNELLKLGADLKAIATTQPLRVVGTLNSKYQNIVKELIDNDIKEYDLYDLYNKYLPYDPKEKKPKAKRKSKVTLMQNSYNLNCSRFNDLKKILKLRDYDIEGCRNAFMMLYGTYYILSTGSSSDKVMKELEWVSSKIKAKGRTSQSELRTIIRNGYKRADNLILPRNETIINMLSISEEEQRELSTIISLGVKRERGYETKKVNRRNDDGLTKREQQKNELIKKVEELYKKGYKQVEIVEELRVSKGRISQIIKEKKFNETAS